MEIERTAHGSATVLRCQGRLTMTSASRLREAVDQAVQDGRHRLVADLAETEFVDSSGLGALVSGLKRARQCGGDLRIAAPVEQVRTVLSLTNLDRVLRPYPTVEDATRDW
ncbi:STAS domain-containing protein [Ornithinicoccus halotolerans]|uniref:STAS domain-containing protein n=1 Tax=Ornithinicoccus halotolerans TaxID=1748220 RepID=UPI001297DE64|nr:STAS domain-containing protein [Ornithinicoccus halotolerans]